MASENMTIHSLNFERVTTTQNAIGGQVRSYTGDARGSLPRSVLGRGSIMTAKEKIDHGVRGEIEGWKFLVPDVDPQVTTADRIVFIYFPGEGQRTVKVIKGSHPLSPDAPLWRIFGELDTTER